MLHTDARYPSRENGTGAGPNTPGSAITGNVLDIDAEVKLVTNANRPRQKSAMHLRHREKFNGSAGSSEGWGTSNSSFWDTSWPLDVRVKACSGGALDNRNEKEMQATAMRNEPINREVPGGEAFFTSALERAKA